MHLFEKASKLTFSESDLVWAHAVHGILFRIVNNSDGLLK